MFPIGFIRPTRRTARRRAPLFGALALIAGPARAQTRFVSTNCQTNSTAYDTPSNPLTLQVDAANVTVQAGALSSTGSVTTMGTDFLTFSANNTYSGMTTISAGTLQIGAGGTSGAITSGSAGAATLDFALGRHRRASSAAV